jgi:hypothetical protein
MVHDEEERMRRGVTALLCVAALVVAAAASAEPVITLANPKVFTAAGRPWVKFTHESHQALEGVSCLTCHHDFVKGKNVLDPGSLKEGDPSLRCAACHASPAGLQNAFHGLCITCHDAEKSRGHVTGPRTCGECHAW